jgi:hypothetical protein
MIDQKKLDEANHCLDLLFSRGERVIHLFREAGFEDKGNEVEREFFALHDSAIEAHAAIVTAAKADDYEQVQADFGRFEKVIEDITDLSRRNREWLLKVYLDLKTKP